MELEDLVLFGAGGIAVAGFFAILIEKSIYSLTLRGLSRRLKKYSFENCTDSLQRYLNGEDDFLDINEEVYRESQKKLAGFMEELDECGGLLSPFKYNPEILVRLRSLEYRKDLTKYIR